MKVTKDEIVVAARELFREKGYVGASMQDLATEIGLKKASLYMRFSNKEALVPEVLGLTLSETLSSSDGSDVPWDVAFEALVRGITSTFFDRKRCVGLHLAYGVGDETPLAKEAVRTFFQSILDAMTATLARAMPRQKAERLATDALVRLEGATLVVALFDDRDALQRAIDGVLLEAKAAATPS